MNSAAEKGMFELRRQNLVLHMLQAGAVKSKSVENAFRNVKRELFGRPVNEEAAYADSAIPVGYGQTISQPSTIAVMLEMLQAEVGNKVLEVGCGCGYVLALLSEIVGVRGKVYGIEIIDALKETAEKNLEKQGCGNVELFSGDGTLGLPEKAPFNRVIVSAACPYIPKPLFEQLVEGGRIVAPVGDRFTQAMQALTKKDGKPVKSEYPFGYFVFVPLRGKYGWGAER